MAEGDTPPSQAGAAISHKISPGIIWRQPRSPKRHVTGAIDFAAHPNRSSLRSSQALRRAVLHRSLAPMRRCIAVLTGTLSVALFLAAPQTAFGHAWKVCASGTITLGSFGDHVAELRKSIRYPAEDIDDLGKKARQGGP